MRTCWTRSTRLLLAAGFLLVPIAAADAQGSAGLRLKATTTKLAGKDYLILLNNCDDSDRNGQPDNQDAKVNGPHDWKQLDPIHLEGAAAGTVSLHLTSAGRPPQPVRLFKVTRRAADGTPEDAVEILGPTAGIQYVLVQPDLDDLAAKRFTLYAEGLDFAREATLILKQSGNNQEDRLELYTAPFLLLPHTQAPIQNLVVNDGTIESRIYVRRFSDCCQEAKVEPVVLPSKDVWIEDEISLGYTETPRQGLHIVLHMARFRKMGLDMVAKRLVAPGLGYWPMFHTHPVTNQVTPDHGGGLHSGGNLECTPPAGKWKHGRVYLGSVEGPKVDAVNPTRRFSNRKVDASYPQFFQRQRLPGEKHGIQEPIELWTNWLGVGHVDEVVTFLPAKNAKGFVVALASPGRALKLLDPDNHKKLSQRERGLDLHGIHYRSYGISSMDDLAARTSAADRYFHGDPTLFNHMIHEIIMGADPDNKVNYASYPRSFKRAFMEELGLVEADFIEFPTLFGTTGSDILSFAVSPGVVNLSSMGKYCMIPDPFIPSFKKEVEDHIKKLDLIPLWIDDWEIYHRGHGEVHCGSNMVRQPFDNKWWNQ